MNWYSIFYWISVADKVSDILSTIAIITLLTSIVTCIGWFVSASNVSENTSGANETASDYNKSNYLGWLVWLRAWKVACVISLIFCFISSIMWAALPTKKDALLIVAGGAVGQFITTDSSAKQIPAEAMTLLRAKIRSEIVELNNPIEVLTDTLQEKSKEELIELLKNKK